MAMRRFRVAEDSMRPTLVPGDEIVATDSIAPLPGDLVVFPHPHRDDDFWLVKRLVELSTAGANVGSDNPSVTTADSRSLGPVPTSGLLKVVDLLDETTFPEACAMLAAEEPGFAGVLARHGTPQFWKRPEGLPTLVLFILEQQVSLESGVATYRRLLDLVGEMTTSNLLRAGPDRIAGVGVTRQKTGYLIGLAEAVESGNLDLGALNQLTPRAARESLIAHRGIGPWTADVYLLAAIGSTDVFPTADRALQVGTAELLGMSHPATPDELEVLSGAWRPVRAAAARLIWHNYLSVRNRVEPIFPGPDL